MDKTAFDAFYQHLISVDRKPIVVLSVREGDSAPLIPLEEVRGDLGDAADVYVLPAEASFWLTDSLGDRALSIYSGWARVYPSGMDWLLEPRLAPRFSPLYSDKKETVNKIVMAVLSAAYRGKSYSAQPSRIEGEQTTVLVKGSLSQTQILVEKDRERAVRAIMMAAALFPGIPADRLVSIGQRFTGRLLDADGLFGGAFSPDPIADEIETRAAKFIGDGIVTLAQVAELTPESARVALHPQFALNVEGRGAEDLTLFTRLYDVVTVEVVPHDGGFLVDFSADEAQPSMSVLPGGPPWLVPVDPPDESPQEIEAVRVGAYAGVSEDALIAHEELERVKAELRLAESTIRDLQRELRRSRRRSIPTVFGDTERQLRYELEQTYLTEVAESERDKYPWPNQYVIGPEFIASMDKLVANGGIDRDRIVRVSTEVLCGLAKDLHDRALREWTVSAHGPAEIRDRDKAVAMRVRLQAGTPAARRMKYWQLQNGDIELHSVGLHDDGIKR